MRRNQYELGAPHGQGNNIMRKSNQRQRNRQRLFTETGELISTIALLLENPETNIIVVGTNNSPNDLVLAGPNKISKVGHRLFCARKSQLEEARELYQDYVITVIEATSRMERASENGVGDLRKVKFEKMHTRKEWRKILASWHEDDVDADLDYDYNCMLEHWFSDEYWVTLDRECDSALTNTFLGHPLWHLRISRKDAAIRTFWLSQPIGNLGGVSPSFGPNTLD
jgi:hypothetical protein